MVLPLLGGSPAVWNTCLLFFQALLLAGYLYAHVTSKWLSARTQALLHCALLAAAIFLLPMVAGTIGTIQATEAIKYLAGFEEGLITDRLLVYDAKVMKFHDVEVERDPKCAACGATQQNKTTSSIGV